MRVIVGITGATGAVYGVRVLERLRDAGVETHLVISRWGARTLLHESDIWMATSETAVASAAGFMLSGAVGLIVAVALSSARWVQRAC